MREIKFRAWDGEKMFTPSSINFKNDTLWVCDSHGDNKLEYEMINPRAELMQFTGLKDKNGKEIYEGDIVRVKWLDEKELRVGAIEWWSERLTYEVADQNDNVYLNECFQIKVIGNIYENKELLKEDSK